jgi:hypothetical protein
MHFGGRWVPMQVADTIFLLWAIAVVIVGAVLFWLMRSGRSTKVDRDTSTGSTTGKGTKRHKRRKR